MKTYAFPQDLKDLPYGRKGCKPCAVIQITGCCALCQILVCHARKLSVVAQTVRATAIGGVGSLSADGNPPRQGCADKLNQAFRPATSLAETAEIVF
jgi:hypothetical protein